LLLAACSNEDFLRRPLTELAASDGVVELSHAVEVRLDRGEVRLTVTRVYRNDAPSVAELERDFVLPEGAVATSLRVLAEGRWQAAALMGAEAARDRWWQLVRPGDAQPTPMGMLAWSSDQVVTLRYWPLLPGETATIEYEVAAPPHYEAGSWWLDYPRDEEASLGAVPELAAAPQLKRAGLSFEERRAAAEDGLGQDTQGPIEATRVRIPRPAFGELDARWATNSFAPGRTWWRLEVDVAAELLPAPRQPHVVFAVDASFTQEDDGLAAQLALLDGFLAEARDAQVEVIVYRRFAERLFGRFLPADEVKRALAALPASALALGNGSNLDEAAALAARSLAGMSGPSRVVLFTDEFVKRALDDAGLRASLAALPAEAVVHVVNDRNRYDYGLDEVRDLEALFAGTAEAHGGVALAVSGRETEAGQARQVMRGLVRPVRIDDFRVEVSDFAMEVPGRLDEGSEVRQLAFADSAPPTVTLRGRVWARQFERTLNLDADLAERLPALVLGSPGARPQLTDAEELAAAQAARAVTKVTSYLLTAPEAAPSRLGADRYGGPHGFGIGSAFGCGGISTHSSCGGTGLDLAALLRPLLEGAVASCGAREVTVALEATADEVVDASVSSADAAADACVTEALWALRLPDSFRNGACRFRMTIH
jgi:hypothetical protein